MKKFFKIYFPFASNEIKRQMAYKGTFYLFIFISLFGSFISYFLWMSIYGSSGNGVICGLSKNEMVIYVFMVYVTSSVVNISLSRWLGDDIVKGTVAMNLIKPIDYRTSLVTRALGNGIFNFVCPSVFIWIILEVYKVFVLNMKVTSITNIVLYLLSCFMSFLIYVLFDFCFGMIAFFTTYIFGMQMVKNALLSFLSGQLIPISFFPEIMQRIFDFLPFSSMIYTPVMVYLGKYTGYNLLFVLLRQAAWIFILYVLGSLIWRKVTKRLVVLGG